MPGIFFSRMQQLLNGEKNLKAAFIITMGSSKSLAPDLSLPLRTSLPPRLRFPPADGTQGGKSQRAPPSDSSLSCASSAGGSGGWEVLRGRGGQEAEGREGREGGMITSASQ